MFKLKKLLVLLGILNANLVGYNLAYAEDIQSSTTKLPDQSGFFAKEKWGAGYLNYMNGPSFADSTGGSINHLLTLKRKFNSDWALALTIRPDSNFGNEKENLTMSDPFIKLSFPTLFKTENGLKLSGDLIYYVPFSDSSKTSNLSGVISPRFSASYDTGNLNFLYLLIPKGYLNNKTQDGQKLYSHSHYMAMGYKLSTLLTIDFALNPAWTIRRNQSTEFNDLPVMPGMTFNFSKDVSFSPYVEVSLLKPSNKTSSAGGVLSYTLL